MTRAKSYLAIINELEEIRPKLNFFDPTKRYPRAPQEFKDLKEDFTVQFLELHKFADPSNPGNKEAFALSDVLTKIEERYIELDRKYGGRDDFKTFRDILDDLIKDLKAHIDTHFENGIQRL